MKHVVVASLIIFILFLMGYTFKTGRAYQGGHVKIIENIATFENKKSSFAQPDEVDQLKALKEKAGNIGAFKVSKLYKSRCASCHGVNGNGIIGPKLFGQKSNNVYKKLKDYKAGRIESPVMRGILMNVEKEDLKMLANEIGKFSTLTVE